MMKSFTRRLLRWLLRRPMVVGAVGRLRSEVSGAPVQGASVTSATRALWSFDEIIDVPGQGYWLRGWLIDPARELSALELRDAGSSQSWDLLAQAQRYPRLDVAQHHGCSTAEASLAGFIAFARLPHQRPAPMMLEARMRNGASIQQLLPGPISPDAMAATQLILAPFTTRHPALRTLMDQHVGPALERIWSARPESAPQPVIAVFGRQPERPRASILVPLYGRYDFLRYQLALFATDPGMRGVELIYVVDDPRILGEALALARGVAPVFGLPFKLVHCGRNLGFAGANNLGARAASGEFLVLLNSDVMPRGPGWLDALMGVLHSRDDTGVVGPVLLYEDGSVQHAGMELKVFPEWAGYRINVHPGKGLPFTEHGQAPREVPAITGACMVLRRALYEELGGLDEGYVLGDFEDSDLCHRIRARGQTVLLVPSVQLYHLERQSQSLFEDPGWKAKLSLYNCWRHECMLGGAAA